LITGRLRVGAAEPEALLAVSVKEDGSNRARERAWRQSSDYKRRGEGNRLQRILGLVFRRGTVIVNDIREDWCASVADEITTRGGRALAYPADITA
jgi:hypothetical protein